MTSCRNLRSVCLVVALFFSATVFSQLKMPGIFTDHMVLQQKMPVPIWGTSMPGKKITVQFAGQKKEVTSDDKGYWRVTLDALAASAEGRQLTVSDGNASIKIADVLVGEVWIGSGQSNMGVSLAEIDDSENVIANANNPLVRMIKVPQTPALKPRKEIDAKWMECKPANAKPFSAIGYFFAQKLQKELNVPVGFVVCAWGGSSVLAWMSEEALTKGDMRGNGYYDLVGYWENHRPRLLYNGMLHPLLPLATKGVLWYQGETDAMDERFNPYRYRIAFKNMIDDWRSAWKRNDLPFYFVQLPNLFGGKYWPVLRESQDMVYRSSKNIGMITTIDIGQSRKLHPTNKSQFSYRLADLVLAEQYGKSTPSKFPAFDKLSIEKEKARITFSHANGLKTADGAAPLAFEIAGSDQVFKKAQATIDGNAVVVWNKEVTAPVAVRYAFIPDPKVNLMNGEGLPARPFRTDSWPVFGSDWMGKPLTEKALLENQYSPQQIVDGKAESWQWLDEKYSKDTLIADKSIAKVGNKKVRIQVITRRSAKKDPSAIVAWKQSIPDPVNGITFEVESEMVRANTTYSGISLQAGIKNGNKLNVYKIEFTPLALMAMNEEFIFVMGDDMDNSGLHPYRLSIRKDGFCQVYYDHQLIGVVPPEVIEDKETVAKGSYILFGKIREEGDISANIESISFDGTGAYAPAQKTVKQTYANQ